MILKAAIVHILDSSVGIPVLSDQSMEVGHEFSDFLYAHIEKITESDDVKHCTFAEGSEVKELLQNCTPDNFVETSKQLAERLYDIMNANIDIPAADVAMTVFGCKGKYYLAFLKMNYKTSYTHQTRETDGGNSNEIILQRALLPGQGQRLSEAFVLDLSDGSLILAEKKYEVNGEKCFYFSELFLECRAPLSQKSKLDIVTRAVDQVAKKYYGDEDAQKKMEINKRNRAKSRCPNCAKKYFPAARRCSRSWMKNSTATTSPTRRSRRKMNRRSRNSRNRSCTLTPASRSRSRWKNTEIPTMWSLSPTWTGQSRC